MDAGAVGVVLADGAPKVIACGSQPGKELTMSEGLDAELMPGDVRVDGHPPHAIGALGILVLPGHIVARAGRENLDLVLGREPLGDEPAVVLGPPEDLGAIPLNDKGDLHSYE